MVNNANELFTILQRSYKRKKKKCNILNKELNEILVIVNGISERLYHEYLINNLNYDELEKYMSKLEHIYNIYIKIKLPIVIKKLNEDIINNYIYSIKYLLHNIIKKCGAKNCSHIMQIFFSKNWFNTLNRGYIHLFKLYNRLFIPKNVRIVNKMADNSIYLPYARKIDIINDDFIMALNGAELVCPLLDKDIIISGYFITDPLTNISQEKQMKSKYNKLLNNIKNKYNNDFFINYVKQLSLRDFIVLSVSDIINQIENDYKFLKNLKKDNLPSIIKVFLQANLYNQHRIITLFLLDTIDSKFMAHIIFDMLYTDNGVSASIPNGSILYKNLHWTLQKNFKKTYNEIEEYKKKINKLTTEKIPYETKIIAIKASDDVKEKAIEKLKEFNMSKDGSISAKCSKYLDGFLKIPFGIYREEFIITFLDNFKKKLNNMIKNDKMITNVNNVSTATEITKLLDKYKNNENYNIMNQEWIMYNNKKLEYMKFVRNTLDQCVYGHLTVKKQLERVIAQWINGKNNGAVLGLLGPPGIGKTCLIKHGLSKCLVDENGNSRPFSFIPLGGSTNSSYLVGHSYTYVGSTWGKIIDILMDSKCMNPILFFDELDKVSNTEHGREIISILTHLTDSTQNSEFCDKFFTGIKFDLSKCLIIFTYNDINKIDRILKDRITTIELKSLNKQDKIIITKKYLLPEIYEVVGFSINDIIFEDESIEYIIDCYTYEAGVRKLKEKLFEIIREINLISMTENSIKYPFTITIDYITKLFIDKSKVRIKKISSKPLSGIVNGLYATEAGIGGLTIIQVFRTICDSKELKLEYTGNQGDVMKESIKCAKTIAWNLIPAYIKEQIKDDWEINGSWGLHIHCPDTSTPKDGPSAGGAITLAIISNLCNIEVKNTVAMTGEIDLNGNITAIGGVQSKLEGAISAGATLALLPKENELDYNKIKNKLLIPGETDKYRIEVKFLETIYDILENALVEDHGIDFIDLKN